MRVFRTINHEWRLLKLTNGKHYVRKQLTKRGMRTWWGE